MSRLAWLKLFFMRYYRDMGLRVALYALLSLVATLVSPVANIFLSDSLKSKVDFDAVIAVLTILSSSMLAVSTFSLSIMVSAHRAAADAATPRVHRILLEDTTTQSVLAAFIGAFVYSLGSIVLYRLGFYAEDSAFVSMIITTAVVIWVILSLLRWIQHLTTLGSVQESLQSAKIRAGDTLLALARHPRHGAADLTDDTVLPLSTTPLRAARTGFVQFIDVMALESCLPDGAAAYLDIGPGSHVLRGEVIGQISGSPDQATMESIGQSLTVGDIRTHEQDAEFGLVVLSEIASKALSPGVNDPGTAIEAVLAIKSVLWDYIQQDPDPEAQTSPRVYARFPGPEAFIESAFLPIARDGADTIEVALKLRETLAALSGADDPQIARTARAFAEFALSYSERAALPKPSMDRLRAIRIPPSDQE